VLPALSVRSSAPLPPPPLLDGLAHRSSYFVFFCAPPTPPLLLRNELSRTSLLYIYFKFFSSFSVL
jgi:hypothetical protein